MLRSNHTLKHVRHYHLFFKNQSQKQNWLLQEICLLEQKLIQSILLKREDRKLKGYCYG